MTFDLRDATEEEVALATKQKSRVQAPTKGKNDAGTSNQRDEARSEKTEGPVENKEAREGTRET